MKILLVILLAPLLCVACGRKEAEAPGDKYADPEFREAQREKAIAAYRELTESYPDSEFAEEAEKRLQVLEK